MLLPLLLPLLVRVEYAVVKTAVRACSCLGSLLEGCAAGFTHQLRVLASACSREQGLARPETCLAARNVDDMVATGWV